MKHWVKDSKNRDVMQARLRTPMSDFVFEFRIFLLISDIYSWDSSIYAL